MTYTLQQNSLWMIPHVYVFQKKNLVCRLILIKVNIYSIVIYTFAYMCVIRIKITWHILMKIWLTKSTSVSQKTPTIKKKN